MPFRFLIGPVLIDSLEKAMSFVSEPVIIEAPNYSSAAAEAESRWPGQQFFVAKIGRIHNAGTTDILPLTSGAEG